ncbi:uncharacterized protein KY384_002343 [Bacidia gigantensis]|uniref:uncharacterized protein n=1 Tax=Bacidia gigantensis TaxID=2732470 RepID=UPI001D03FEA0|nr:uncharacterized protein KY384_002343 [Bacidia gigantensis]KAG8532466.1 hypothetical protein KY384_002343 [Bacidia gigantensis]
MAHGKKKKKSAPNPARAVATTSVASKKHDQGEADPESDPQVGIEAKSKLPSRNDSSNPDGPTTANDQAPERPLHELSPEELEAHLEEADLQNLVDKHAEKIKREASRQVSRLETEKRLLRTHSDRLTTKPWLPDEVVQLVLDFVHSERATSDSNSYKSRISSIQELSSDEIVLRMWQLHLMLPHLSFPKEDISEVLRHTLHRYSDDPSSLALDTRDDVWGLETCLDWLARKTAGQNESDYSFSRQEVTTIEQTPVNFGEDTANAHGTGTSTPTSWEFVTNQETNDDKMAEISDLPSDMEPEQLVDRYLQLQRRLFEIDAKVVESRPGKINKNRVPNSTRNSHNNVRPISPKIKRLQAQIAKITSDILFDSERAQMLWESHYIELCQEKAARQRLDIDDHTQPDSPVKSRLPDEPVTTEDTESGVGDFFSSLPELSANPEDGSALQTTDDGGRPIQIRDFGTWNGMAPRRVLEDACKARDPSAKVTFSVISKASFSCRHAVQIQWSKPQQQDIVSSPLDSMSTEGSNSRQARLAMISVSCPNSIQSETFVATVALFSIVAHSPREEKASFRLPGVWRDLWAEMTRRRQEQEDTVDRETLRTLRKLVADAQISSEIDLTPSKDTRLEYSESTLRGRSTLATGTPTDLQQMWHRKASSAKYKAMLTSRARLPVWQYREQILEAITSNQVVIICGATGCGKSTQVPAYILEYELSNQRHCKIYCSEPRRISAISLARRVSEELGEQKNDVGTARSLVGFAVRLDSQMTAQTRLVYATTGVIMRMLEGSETLEDITHLLLDEVHERSIDSDFLLIVLRKLLVKRPSLKVVLMSATVDAQKFSAYLGDAPIFEVPGRTFPVETRYLEDAIELTHFKLGDVGAIPIEDNDADQEDDSEPASTKESHSSKELANYSLQTRKTLAQLNEYRIPFDLIIKLLEKILSGQLSDYNKATLIFLPGIAEIRRLHDMLTSHPTIRQSCEIFAMHSSIATEDQERAFLVPPKGMRKIVLATNIAETGITIPDITCVIDTGKHKEMRFDERRQLSRLLEVFISQANATQRRGRAGRVQNGLCFHLFSKQRFERMAKEQTPEILRLSLQDLVLRVKIYKMGGIEETLSEALDPPSAKNIRRAVDALQDVKALTVMQNLTSLGRQLARLPLDVFLGKLLLLGTIFGCLDATLTIAATFSAKSPFNSTMDSRTQVDQARLSFKRGDSDLLTAYNAYSAWRRVCNITGVSEQQFCRKSFLSVQTLLNIEDIKGQLFNSLIDAGLLTLTAEERGRVRGSRPSFGHRNFVDVPARYNINGANDTILNTTIAMSFYPKLLKREGRAWRNVANNQSITLHPTSVNKRSENPPSWVSFYHVMQSGNKSLNAHETSAVDDLAVALCCGDADFKMHAGVLVVDGNRIKFSVKDRAMMLVLKTLRSGIKAIVEKQIKQPGSKLDEKEQHLMDIWQRVFTAEETRTG